jgi:hypothetical protein
MMIPTFKRTYLQLFIIATVLFFSPFVWAKKIALLVGVSQYANASHNLMGPANDVKAWQDLLEKNFAVNPTDIVVLLNDKANKPNILLELDRLKTRSQAGDEIVLFFSGHGTSALDKSELIPLPQGTGAFITHEKQFIIGRTDILPRLLTLDKDRKIWFISDSCYSQNMARSTSANLINATQEMAKPKYIAINASEISDRLSAQEKQALKKLDSSIPPYPYQNTVTLAAASEGEVALDLPASDTFDGKPHGALTNALIPLLAGKEFADFDGNRVLDANEINYAVTQKLRSMSLGQTPQILPASVEDKTSLRQTPFLGQGQKLLMQQNRPVFNQQLKVFVAKSVPLPLQEQLKQNANLQMMAAGAAFDLAITANSKAYEFFDAKNESIGRFSSIAEVQAKLLQEQFNLSLKRALLKKQNGVMELELLPSRFGSFFEIGEQLKISMKSPQPVYILLVVINSKAEVSVVYPTQAAEFNLKPANKIQFMPEDGFFTTTAPSGVDYLHVLGLPQMPTELKDQLIKPIDSLHVSHSRVQGLFKWLEQSNLPMLYNSIEIVVHEASK